MKFIFKAWIGIQSLPDTVQRQKPSFKPLLQGQNCQVKL
jgi:hypothetical protein